MKQMILEIQNLHVNVDQQPILKNLNLQVYAGEVHAIMGPNGAGKSTLAHILARKPGYTVLQGSIRYQGQDLLALSPEEAAWAGIFLGFQYPVVIPGVANIQFLKSMVNSARQKQNLAPYDAADFLNIVKEKMIALNFPEQFLYRALNEGFSGGEKKRNEILQMFLLEPVCAILDETDSGLDIDALKSIAQGIHLFRSPTRAIILITHYQRLLNYIEPDVVHVLLDGKIVRSGDKHLAKELENKGYTWL